MREPAQSNVKQPGIAVIFLLASLFVLTGFWRGTPSWEKIGQEIDAKFPDVPSISMEALQRQIGAGTEMLLVDVRSREEYVVSHILHAVHMTSPEDLTVPPDSFVVCYCSVGYRSAAFVQKARKLGYTNIVNYKGSIFQWANAGKPVYRDGKVVTGVHPYDDYWGQLLKPELHAGESVKP